MKLSEIEEARTDITHEAFVPVHLKGAEKEEKLRVVYRPLTPEMLPLSTVAWIMRAVIEWDLEADDGSPYPRTAEALDKLPLPFLGSIVEAVTGDYFPGKKK